MLFMIMGWNESIAQQQVQFSQYMFNKLVINPAYAGADEVLSAMLIHRSQWSGVDNAPSTTTFSIHTLFRNKHNGLGFLLLNDQIGIHKEIGARTNYAYHLKVGASSFLSMGIQAGIHNKKSDYASLADPSVFDPKVAGAAVSNTFFDFGTGIYFRNERLQVSVSAPQLMPERFTVNDSVSLRFARTNFFGFAQYKIHTSENVDLEPSVLLKYYAGTPLSFDLNLNAVFYRVLTFGMSYRKKESIDLLLRGQLTPQLEFGYAYDYPIGDIQRLSNGSHELMVHYLFRYIEKSTISPR